MFQILALYEFVASPGEDDHERHDHMRGRGFASLLDRNVGGRVQGRSWRKVFMTPSYRAFVK